MCVVKPDVEGFLVSVYLDKPLPERLEGRTGLNLEFLPSAYFEKTYLVDGRPGIFPLYPSGPMKVRPADTQIRQFAGHSTFDDRGRKEYVEAEPIASGTTLVLAPADPERRVTIRSVAGGDLTLLDGRNVAQNGWYVVRTLLPAKATGKVVEWSVRPHTIAGWKRAPVIGFSQAGYHPAQQKVGVIELDTNDTPLATASVFEVTAEGDAVERLAAKVEPWGKYLRYAYASFDFSSIERPGLYFIQYGDRRTETFPIDVRAHASLWHQTLDVWFPVQMDHMFVNEAYRVWHGAAHLDDARQAPVDHQHFDGYRMGPSTETRYKPGEHVPGLNVGGWFDAGDDDIRTGSHSAAVMHLVDTWEHFKPKRDETLVDQARRYVDIHHPDGKPDILQQIEQGALALVAQHRAFGRAIPGIIAPQLHQYHHLGDWSTQTDGRLYDPSLPPYESDGTKSGTPDDRWVFTNKSAWNNDISSAALAAASRALRGYNDALADECLAAAKKAWDDERQSTTVDTGLEALFRPARRAGGHPPAADQHEGRPVCEEVRGADRTRSRPIVGLEHLGRRPSVAVPRRGLPREAAPLPPEVPRADRCLVPTESLRRADHHPRLGGQRGRDQLGRHQLPFAQGVPRAVRAGARPAGAQLHPRSSPGVERLVRLRCRDPLQEDRVRDESRGLQLHRRWRGSRCPGPEAGLPRAQRGLAVPLGRERVRDRHLCGVHLSGERRERTAA